MQNVLCILKFPDCPKLSEWLSCLKEVTKWKTFAAYLLPSGSADTEIEKIDITCQNDVDECKRVLYNTFKRVGERTWTKVVQALQDSYHLNAAKEIKKRFHQ